jgi:DNA modification methylase
MNKKVRISEIVFRNDLYPRLEHNQQKAQEYSENIEYLPPIIVNQHNELIDGKHRFIAHQLADREEIDVEVWQTASDLQLLHFAIKTNSAHGQQLSQSDKKRNAQKLYGSGERGAEAKKELSQLLSVTIKSINTWVADFDKTEREERKKKIYELWTKCYTAEEIGEVVGLSKQAMDIEVCLILENLPKLGKVQFSEEDFTPPIYNIWSYGKKTNETSHFGNTEQRILENLLYLYTEPGDIVVDPFGGGGSTLDVCIKRGRRCYISDRKPKPGMQDKIRTLDITESLPGLNKRWSDVSLTYLDPPYWKQAENKYSYDKEDLANYESADAFHDAMAKVINEFAKKQSKGVIAFIIQPTQWRSDKQFTDHVFEILKRVKTDKLKLENRISCPYQTEQCTPQMVNYAKENKMCLVLTRELVVLKVVQ